MSRSITRSLLLDLFSSLLLAQPFSQRVSNPPQNNPNSPPNTGAPSSSPNPYALPPDPQFNPKRNAQDQPSDAEVKLKKDHEKQMNKNRFEALKKDTEKLLSLANELKQNVDKSTEDTLSLDVVKKTEEIEKLAKKVREKMIAN